VLQRHAGARQPETVYLLTSAPPPRLEPAPWLRLNRAAWGIENGLHQRLDVTAQEDQSRVRNRNAVHVLAIFRRLGISLFMHWRAQSRKRAKPTLRDFHDAMALQHQRGAFQFVSTLNPQPAPRL
jgi:hypothetical protein